MTDWKTCPSDACPRGCTLKFSPDCPGERNPWRCYELEKATLTGKALPPMEYEKKIRAITDRLGL
jgi:hypothetical protein